LKTSIVITTNRGVGAWGEILGDTTVAAAMLDRLLHRSVVINLDGESYRLRDHQAPETLRRAITGNRQQLHWPLLTGEEFRRAHLGTFEERDQRGRFSKSTTGPTFKERQQRVTGKRP
jgi:hypothetical protein